MAQAEEAVDTGHQGRPDVTAQPLSGPIAASWMEAREKPP